MVDGRFFVHFFWKVEGSSAHTRESRAAHVYHMQLTCGKLLYGGGEPSRVAHVYHVCHVWQLMCTLLLYSGGEPSRVAINVYGSSHVVFYIHSNYYMVEETPHVWQLTCTVAHVWHFTCTAITRVEGNPLTCGKLLYGGGEPSRVAHVYHVWQLMCTLLLYGGGEPSRVAINVYGSSHVAFYIHSNYYMVEETPHVW